eukprot:1607756-Amphidinium_carterae.1
MASTLVGLHRRHRSTPIGQLSVFAKHVNFTFRRQLIHEHNSFKQHFNQQHTYTSNEQFYCVIW